MKRNKIIAVVLVVLMMAGALVLAGCKDKGCNVGACGEDILTCTDSSCAVVQAVNSGSYNQSVTCNCD